MAKETADHLIVGNDYERAFHIQNAEEDTAINIAGYTLSYMIKRRKSDADLAAIVTKTTTLGIVIAGAFDADPDVNAQRATVSVSDTDTESLTPGLAYYELKRTTAGFETVLAYGPVDLARGVHRA